MWSIQQLFLSSAIRNLIVITVAFVWTSKRCAGDENTPANRINDGDQKLFHVLVYNGFSFSHCLESFGAAQMLVDHGEFEATIFAQKPCRPLADRAKQVTRYAERLHIVDAVVPPEKFAEIHTIFAEFAEQGVFGDKTFRSDQPSFRQAVIAIDDYPLRGDHFSLIQQLHAARPFNVALCDVMTPACWEFADKNGIAAILIGYQGDLFRQEIEHNGLWLASCPPNNRCSLRRRLSAILQHFTPFHLLPSFVVPANFLNFFTIMYEIATDLRRAEVDSGRIRPLRSIYPRIDQRIVGTTMPAAYYRSDHAIVGPAWFALQHTELDSSKTAINTAWLTSGDALSSSTLRVWLERAQKPVVYVSFGTLARLNRRETRIVLEGIVSDKWLTIWKTNTLAYVQEFVANNLRNGELPLLDRVQKLISDGNTLRVVDWAPQFGLLHHPTVKLFVTHGGLSSVMEACDSGVPLLCVPLFSDQLTHCAQIDAMGNGLQLSKYDLTSQVLYESIEMLLTNESYAQKAREMAEFHAQMDTAGRLAEFVGHYARFGNDFIHIASDDWRMFNFFTAYWSMDLVLILLSVPCMFILMWLYLRRSQRTLFSNLTEKAAS